MLIHKENEEMVISTIVVDVVISYSWGHSQCVETLHNSSSSPLCTRYRIKKENYVCVSANWIYSF